MPPTRPAPTRSIRHRLARSARRLALPCAMLVCSAIVSLAAPTVVSAYWQSSTQTGFDARPARLAMSGTPNGDAERTLTEMSDSVVFGIDFANSGDLDYLSGSYAQAGNPILNGDQAWRYFDTARLSSALVSTDTDCDTVTTWKSAGEFGTPSEAFAALAVGDAARFCLRFDYTGASQVLNSSTIRINAFASYSEPSSSSWRADAEGTFSFTFALPDSEETAVPLATCETLPAYSIRVKAPWVDDAATFKAVIDSPSSTVQLTTKEITGALLRSPSGLTLNSSNVVYGARGAHDVYLVPLSTPGPAVALFRVYSGDGYFYCLPGGAS